MAKIDIGAKEFTKLLEPLKTHPNKDIIKRIDAKMFPLDQNKVFNYKPEQLAIIEYTRCLNLFKERNPGLSPNEAMLRIGGLQKLISKDEAPIKAQLEQLAIQTIKDIYQVPDYVNMKAFINPHVSLDTEQDHSADPFLELTLEQKNNMRDEIQKRVILNGLVHGSSMQVWKGVYHLVSAELDKLNPGLKELYDFYTSTIGITLWQISPTQSESMLEDNSQITQGFNKLKFDKQQGFGGQIEARALNFAVLLHELNKGVIDWLVSAGIPRNYSSDELRYYYSKADAYENEHWHYLLSPAMWSGLLEAAQLESEHLPKLISRLTQLSYGELVELFRLIQDKNPKANEIIQKYFI